MATFEEYAAENSITLCDWENDELAAEAIAHFYMTQADRLHVGRRRNVPMILDVHVIDRPGFNAVAAAFDDADVIAIYRGLLPSLLALCRAIVSQGGILPHLCTPDYIAEEIVVGMSLQSIVSGESTFTVNKLNDPEREALAQRVYEAAYMCVLAHEFAHIYDGHIDWLNAQTGLPLLAEMAADSLPSLDGWERETLEWDADCWAVQAVLEHVMQPHVHNVDGRSVWTFQHAADHPDIVQDVQIALMGMMTVFLAIASQDDRRHDSERPGTHPHALHRLYGALLQIVTVLSFRTGTELESLAPIYAEQFGGYGMDVIRTFPDDSGNALRTFAADFPSLMDSFGKRLEIWTACWANMHGDLSKHVRGGTLAPPQQGRHPAFPNVTNEG